MKYKIILQRLSEHKDVKKPNVAKIEDSTLGKFSVNEVQENGTLKEIWSCFTCENIGESTDTPKQDKRIVAREYKLEWTGSGKNASLAKNHPEYKMKDGRNTAIWVTCDNVLPTFRNRRILIHVGNYPQDTEGCILLGKSKNDSTGTISSSIVACKEFFDLVKKIGIENIDCLDVKEIQN
ncbi:DUF5675 family protein [Helicobacter mastomyrinus]|uniref:DUF5675 family protein n=1 Tax=Helicobacter mastomyrinus TaxID=287948 RepID=A0ABZ3F5B9_9HELI